MTETKRIDRLYSLLDDQQEEINKLKERVEELEDCCKKCNESNYCCQP